MSNHSFAVVAYKDSPFLSDCLDSLRTQTVKSHIYITTSTPSPYLYEICQKYHVELFVTEQGNGIAHDWNFGLSLAKTKYVTLAHQDDLYDPRYTEFCVNAAEKFPDTLICYTGYSEIVNGAERKFTLMLITKKVLHFIFMPFKKNIKSNYWKKASQAFGTPIPCPSVMFNKETISNFKFSEDYKVSLDWDAWLRIAEMNGRFVYIPNQLLKHRIHVASATTKGIEANLRQQEDLKIYYRIWPKFIANILSKLYAGSYKSNKL